MPTLLKVLNNLADIKSAGDVALRVRTQAPLRRAGKPFNFLLTFFARRQEDIATEDPTHEWDPKLEKLRPVAPFEKDSENALRRVLAVSEQILGLPGCVSLGA